MNRPVLPLLAFILVFAGVAVWYRVNRDAVPPPTAAVPVPAMSGTMDPNDPLCRTPGAISATPAPASVGVTPPPAVSAIPTVTTPVLAGQPLIRTKKRPAAPAAPANPPAPVPETPAVEPDDGTAALENVQTMLRDFRTRMGDNPVGSNAEIMRAVMGGNPVQARLGPPPGQEVNAEGELLDPWGTPWFFHQLSAKSMEVRSAGPDRQLWSTDDLLSH